MHDQLKTQDTDSTSPPRSRLVGIPMMVVGGALLVLALAVFANSFRFLGELASYDYRGREVLGVAISGQVLHLLALLLTMLLPLIVFGPAGAALFLYGRSVFRQRIGVLSGLGRSVAIGLVPLVLADALAKQTFFEFPLLVLGLVLTYGVRRGLPGRRHAPPPIDHLLVTGSAAAIVAWVVYAVLTLGWGAQPQGYALGVGQVVVVLAVALFVLIVGSWFVRPPRYAIVSMMVALGLILGSALAWGQMQGNQELTPEEILLEVPAPTSDGWFPVVIWDNPGTGIPGIRIEAKDERVRLAMTSRDAASLPTGEVRITSSYCPEPGGGAGVPPGADGLPPKTSTIEGRAVLLPSKNQKRAQAPLIGMNLADLTRLHELSISWTAGKKQLCLPLDNALVRRVGESIIGAAEPTVLRNLTLGYLGGLASFSKRCTPDLKDDERMSVDLGIFQGACKKDALALADIRWSVIASGPGARKHLASLRACIQRRAGGKLPSLVKLGDTWILGIGTYVRSGGTYPVYRCSDNTAPPKGMSGNWFVADPLGWSDAGIGQSSSGSTVGVSAF